MKQERSFKYAKNWNKKARYTIKIQPLCSNNPFHGKAEIVHHLHYRRSLLRRLLGVFLLNVPNKSISGYEIPGFDVVSICKNCHKNNYGKSKNNQSLHNSRVWVQQGGLDNHQRFFTAWRLRLNYFILVVWHILLVVWHILFS